MSETRSPAVSPTVVIDDEEPSAGRGSRSGEDAPLAPEAPAEATARRAPPAKTEPGEPPVDFTAPGGHAYVAGAGPWAPPTPVAAHGASHPSFRGRGAPMGSGTTLARPTHTRRASVLPAAASLGLIGVAVGLVAGATGILWLQRRPTAEVAPVPLPVAVSPETSAVVRADTEAPEPGLNASASAQPALPSAARPLSPTPGTTRRDPTTSTALDTAAAPKAPRPVTAPPPGATPSGSAAPGTRGSRPRGLEI